MIKPVATRPSGPQWQHYKVFSFLYTYAPTNAVWQAHGLYWVLKDIDPHSLRSIDRNKPKSFTKETQPGASPSISSSNLPILPRHHMHSTSLSKCFPHYYRSCHHRRLIHHRHFPCIPTIKPFPLL